MSAVRPGWGRSECQLDDRPGEPDPARGALAMAKSPFCTQAWPRKHGAEGPEGSAWDHGLSAKLCGSIARAR